MKKVFFAFVPLLFLGTIFSKAQNMNTTALTWTVDGLTDLSANVTATSYRCTFATNGNLPIIWSQKNGAFVTTLSIQGSSGTWTDVATAGQITYTVSAEGQTGTLTFARDVLGLSIIIDLSVANGGRLNHRYTVTTVN